MKQNDPSSAYGSHPECLPGFMKDRRHSTAAQIVRLSFQESRSIEEQSLNRFPAYGSGALWWEECSYDDRWRCSSDEDLATLLAKLLHPHIAKGERVAIFWGNLAIPTVTLPARLVVAYAGEISDIGPHFWIYPIGGSTLIECLMDGQVTVATIP